nr:reverse transcriptase domain-containing protein [Tanacetum cinerariifolium]
MEELCQPSINGRGELIAPIPIQATDFGLRHHMIQQVQNTCQFHGLPSDDANPHIDKFLKITQHIKQNGVFDDALRLSLFPYSLTHHAIARRKFYAKDTERCYELIEIMTAHHNHWNTSAIRDETSRNISFTTTTESPEVLTGSTNNVPPLVVQPSLASTSFSTISSSKIPEVTKDTKLFDLTMTPVNENCSAVILKKLPKKLGDPGKFLIPCDFPEFDECFALADLGASINLMPLLFGKSFLCPSSLLLVDYVVDPRVPLILRRSFLRTGRALIDVYGEELTLSVDDEAITSKVGQTLKYSYNDVESINRIDVIDVACEEYVQEGCDFILKEIEACLTSESIPSGIDDTNLNLKGDIHLVEELLNNDPSLSPLLPKELNVEEIKTVKSLIKEPLELELKDLPSQLEYAYLEGIDKLSVIIAKGLKDDEKEAF